MILFNKLKLANILQFFISTLFPNRNVLHFTQGPTPCANTLWLNIHLQLGHLKRGYHWVHLKRKVMQFLVNKREQIYDEMVIHVNKSSLSYKQICEHYINSSDAYTNCNGTGDFIIVGPRLFLKWPILIVKPTYVEKLGRKLETKIHEFKCTREDLNLDPSKCSMFMVYNGYNYYAPCLPPMIKEMYYKKGHTEAHLTQVINRFQDIQQLLPTSDARATMDRALLHIHAASSLLNATEVTSGAGMLLLEKKRQYHVPTREHIKGHARIILNCLRRTPKQKVKMFNMKMPSARTVHKAVNIMHKEKSLKQMVI